MSMDNYVKTISIAQLPRPADGQYIMINLWTLKDVCKILDGMMIDLSYVSIENEGLVFRHNPDGDIAIVLSKFVDKQDGEQE